MDGKPNTLPFQRRTEGPVHPLEEHVQGDLTEGEIVAVQDDQIHQFPAEGFQAAALAEDIARVFPHLGFRHRP